MQRHRDYNYNKSFIVLITSLVFLFFMLPTQHEYYLKFPQVSVFSLNPVSQTNSENA